MFYLLPNMPPILENSGEDEVTIAMVEFEKKRSLQRYSRYGSTMPESNDESDKLANILLKTGEISIAENDREYDNLANKMVCAKRIQYGAGFITLISIIVVLILTTIKSGNSPTLTPHTPQHGHSSKISPSDLGFDAATSSISSIYTNSNELDNNMKNIVNEVNSDNYNNNNDINDEINDEYNNDLDNQIDNEIENDIANDIADHIENNIENIESDAVDADNSIIEDKIEDNIEDNIDNDNDNDNNNDLAARLANNEIDNGNDLDADIVNEVDEVDNVVDNIIDENEENEER